MASDTYAPVVSVHGRAPKRNATIVARWGASRYVCPAANKANDSLTPHY